MSGKGSERLYGATFLHRAIKALTTIGNGVV